MLRVLVHFQRFRGQGTYCCTHIPIRVASNPLILTHRNPWCFEAIIIDAPIRSEDYLHVPCIWDHSLRSIIQAWQLSKLLLLGTWNVHALIKADNVHARLRAELIEAEHNSRGTVRCNHPFAGGHVTVVWQSRTIRESAYWSSDKATLGAASSARVAWLPLLTSKACMSDKDLV